MERGASIADITRLLSAEKIGTVLVLDDGSLAGIISERDVIAACSKYGSAVMERCAADIMTPKVITCPVSTDLADVLALMSKMGIRHVPIMRGDALAGLVSVRDILDFQQQLLIADIDRRKQDAEALEQAHKKLENAFNRRTEEFRQARDMAIEANKAKSVFLANMSHELRTPLNAIIGFSDVMTTETFGPIGSPKYRDYVDDINEAGRLLLSLINDILDMAKSDAGKEELLEERVDVVKTAESALKLIRERAADATVTVSHDWEPDLPPLWADARKLQQVLTNLLSNAVKFTEPQGRVSLSIWCRRDSGYVFQVSDTGIGIALEDIPKALSQFGQIDSELSRKFDGTGLGLPLAKKFVELHGGTLDLQSEVGTGTTVTVRFPASRILSAAEANVA